MLAFLVLGGELGVGAAGGWNVEANGLVGAGAEAAVIQLQFSDDPAPSGAEGMYYGTGTLTFSGGQDEQVRWGSTDGRPYVEVSVHGKVYDDSRNLSGVDSVMLFRLAELPGAIYSYQVVRLASYTEADPWGETGSVYQQDAQPLRLTSGHVSLRAPAGTWPVSTPSPVPSPIAARDGKSVSVHSSAAPTLAEKGAVKAAVTVRALPPRTSLIFLSCVSLALLLAAVVSFRIYRRWFLRRAFAIRLPR